MAAVDKVRGELKELLKQGGMADHASTAAAAQNVTLARYAHYAEKKEVYPQVYPPPDAGDGKDVFKKADEAGEGVMTRKEVSKFIGRNISTIKARLQEGFESFNSQFSIEDLRDITEAEFCGIWTEEAKKRVDSTDKKSSVFPTSSAPKASKNAVSYEEIVPQEADFKFSLGHQEMSRVMTQLEVIFKSQPCEWLPVEAMGNLLSQELCYEDVAEFEDALGGEFSEFVKGLPNAELSTNERGTAVLKLKEDKPGPPRKMTLKVTDRSHLWHVLMQAPDARIIIAELEFEFQPMGERKIDTIYNHIASAIWNLGKYVKDAGLDKDTEGKILDTIMLLNKALDVEHPFTVIVEDPTSRSIWQPSTGVVVEEVAVPAQAA
eukprot:TRINITY_DN1112_c0_g4_i1.p1 TRINITY_DN1112_c0_g4~~TRINITY_DN1112_c0_g4_i1.p1  ORF type:complete len:377 (+),score=74.96 TRINITY_DN1112_c0_g4_i1:39-1169(+)